MQSKRSKPKKQHRPPLRVTADPTDKRAAVDISIKLSLQLIATATGTLPLAGAFFVFVATYRHPSFPFYSFSTAFSLFLIASIISGGKGITRARNDGFHGKWNNTSTATTFNQQATFGLLSLLSLIGAFYFGSTSPQKDNSLSNEIYNLKTEILKMQSENKSIEIKIEKITIQQSKKAKLTPPCPKPH